MLLSAVLTLEPLAEAPAPPFLGRAAHAFFLDLVRRADAGLASSLHDEEGSKPFSVSSILGADPRQCSRPLLLPGRDYHLRLTLLEEGLAKLFKEKLLPSLPKELQLEGSAFQVKGVALDRQSHPLAGQESYQELAFRHLFAQGPVPARVSLLFFSPTTFRSQGRNIPLPLPALVFGSLVERWNAFSPIALAPEVRRYAEECLAVARLKLVSRLVEVAGGKQVGFLGACQYLALNRDQYWLRCINLLADFAFYSGVGYKTTMGLGQARRIDYGGALPHGTGSHLAQRGRTAGGDQR